MLLDMLILFILITIISFILSIFLLEDKPLLALPFITLGFVFSILCTYGMYYVEIMNNSFNSTTGVTTLEVTGFYNWGDPYAVVFVLMFFIFLLLFIRCGYNMWRIALETEGEINYHIKVR